MKSPVRLLAKASLGLLVIMVGFAIIYNGIHHGLIYSDWKLRDKSSESDLRMLGQVIRRSHLLGTKEWVDNLLSEYERNRDQERPDFRSMKEKYTFFTGGFVEKELPVILPKTSGKGGYVVYSSGLVVWMTKQQLDESLSIISGREVGGL